MFTTKSASVPADVVQTGIDPAVIVEDSLLELVDVGDETPGFETVIVYGWYELGKSSGLTTVKDVAEFLVTDFAFLTVLSVPVKVTAASDAKFFPVITVESLAFAKTDVLNDVILGPTTVVVVSSADGAKTYLKNNKEKANKDLSLLNNLKEIKNFLQSLKASL